MVGTLRSHQPHQPLGSGWLAVSWFYILYFGLGLPFICWGALATPGHPHSRPHFVFSDPPIAAHAQHAHHHDAQSAVPPLEQHSGEQNSAEPADVAGQAVPALGVALLLLFLVARAAIAGAPLYNFPRTLPLPRLYSYQPILPSPPPRPVGA